MKPMKSSAWSNDTNALITWLPDAKIAGCLGFAITRIDVETGERYVLRTYVPFEGQTNDDWQSRSCFEWPIQKCQWLDHAGAHLYGKTVKYEIVPLVGSPGSLTPVTEMTTVTNQVTFHVRITDYISAAFTRGVLSTQWLTNQLPKLDDGTPDFNVLLSAISTPGNPIRVRLMGNVMKLVKAQIEAARQEGGDVLLALYELADPEVVEFLLDNTDLFSLILSNTSNDDETNREARARLHEASAKLIDRMLAAKGAIGHNKSQVRRDREKRAKSITTGSTNLTITGLTCQSNNIMQIDCEELAELFVEYWMMLKADNAEQGDALRNWCRTRRKEIVLPDGTRITVWFSPNTELRVKPSQDPPTPVDMEDVFAAMDGAKDAVFFLAFYPGRPSIVHKIKDMSWTRKELLLRGAVSSPQALPWGRLYHRRGELPKIVAAAGLEEEFAAWSKELLKLPDAHAIIHDKLVCIDPTSIDDCVLIVTCHNLGFKASYSNDENMLIIRGCRKACMAYLVHILDVYNHYRFRSAVGGRKSKFQGFLATHDGWLDKYMTGYPHQELVYFVNAQPTEEELRPVGRNTVVSVPEPNTIVNATVTGNGGNTGDGTEGETIVVTTGDGASSTGAVTSGESEGDKRVSVVRVSVVRRPWWRMSWRELIDAIFGWLRR